MKAKRLLYILLPHYCTFKWHQNAWFGMFLIPHCPSVSLTDLPRKLWQRDTQKECVRSADLRPIHPGSSVVVVRTHHYEGGASGVSGGTVKLRHTLWRTLMITVDDSQWLWWLWMGFFFCSGNFHNLWCFSDVTVTVQLTTLFYSIIRNWSIEFTQVKGHMLE